MSSNKRHFVATTNDSYFFFSQNMLFKKRVKKKQKNCNRHHNKNETENGKPSSNSASFFYLCSVAIQGAVNKRRVSANEQIKKLHCLASRLPKRIKKKTKKEILQKSFSVEKKERKKLRINSSNITFSSSNSIATAIQLEPCLLKRCSVEVSPWGKMITGVQVFTFNREDYSFFPF